MSSTQALRRRIRSVSNTKQITKAMELVAAAKLRRVQEAAQNARAYNEAAIGVLRRLSASPETAQHPYFNPPAAKARLYIIFNSDRGLAGAYNSNVFNAAARAFSEDQKAGVKPLVIAFGRKGARRFARTSNIELVGEYEDVADDPDINVFAPVIETIASGVSEGRFYSVVLIFTESISTMLQQVRTLQLLPITPNLEGGEEEKNQSQVVYEFEPETKTVLENAIKLYFESALRRARVEAAASEHAMRMISMSNAARNADEFIDHLTLELNATRQAAITQEIAEIIGGAEAIK